MIIALDTNVLVALWNSDDALNLRALSALEKAYTLGTLVISGAVFAELLASRGSSEIFLHKLLAENEISVDWPVSKDVWRTAGLAYKAYAERRRKSKQEEPRRILTDFLIGAHAAENGYSFLTFDDKVFKAAFPKLQILAIK